MTLDQELRAVLTERAEAWQAPAPDFNAFMAGGRARQRRRVVLTTSAVAVAVAGTLAVGVIVGRGLDPRSGTDPADRPVPTEVTVSPSCIPRSDAGGAGLAVCRRRFPLRPARAHDDDTRRPVVHARPALRVPPFRGTAAPSGMAWLYSDGRLIIDPSNSGRPRSSSGNIGSPPQEWSASAKPS